MPPQLLPASAVAFAPRASSVNVVVGSKVEPWLTLILERIKIKGRRNILCHQQRCLAEMLSAPNAIWILASLLLPNAPEADLRKDANHYQMIHLEAYIEHVDMVLRNEVVYKLTPKTIESLIEYHKDIHCVDSKANTHDWPEKEEQCKKLHEGFVQAVNKFVFRTHVSALEGLEKDGVGELLGGRSEEVKKNVIGLIKPLLPPPPPAAPQPARHLAAKPAAHHAADMLALTRDDENDDEPEREIIHGSPREWPVDGQFEAIKSLVYSNKELRTAARGGMMISSSMQGYRTMAAAPDPDYFGDAIKREPSYAGMSDDALPPCMSHGDYPVPGVDITTHGLASGARRPDAGSMMSLRNTEAGSNRCDRINPYMGKPCNVVFSRPYDLTRHEALEMTADQLCHLQLQPAPELRRLRLQPLGAKGLGGGGFLVARDDETYPGSTGYPFGHARGCHLLGSTNLSSLVKKDVGTPASMAGDDPTLLTTSASGFSSLSAPDNDATRNVPYSIPPAASASSSASSFWSHVSSQQADDSASTAPDSFYFSHTAASSQISVSSVGSGYEPAVKLLNPWATTARTGAPAQSELPVEVRQNPQRTSASATSRTGRSPLLIRQAERKLSFVENLVDTSIHIVEAIWLTSSVPPRNDSGSHSVLPLRTFIQDTLRRSRTSCSTLQVALYYLILIKSHVPTYDFSSEQPDHCRSGQAIQCGRRMFLAALILASKYLQDCNYPARAWSKISGFDTLEINQNEVTFLLAVNWKLHVTQETYKWWADCLSRFTPTQPHPGASVNMMPLITAADSHPQPIAPAPATAGGRAPPVLYPMAAGGVMSQPAMNSPHRESLL